MTRLANEVRAAGTPVYCSACFNHDSSLRHVDFDAACDRGYGMQEAVKVSMDDLVLCETCVKAGGLLVGMVDAGEQAERMASLEERLTAETARCDQAVAYANRMEEALAARPEPVTVTRPRGRPRRNEMAGV